VILEQNTALPTEDNEMKMELAKSLLQELDIQKGLSVEGS